jgi:hypothetical protein
MKHIPRSRREAIALARIEKAKAGKAERKLTFLQKLAKRRGTILASVPCQAGFRQVVDKVTKAGHGFFYTSKACAGCAPGEAFLRANLKKDNTLIQFPDKILGCHKLQCEVLYSEVEVRENDVIKAVGPLQDQDNE